MSQAEEYRLAMQDYDDYLTGIKVEILFSAQS